jgi:hypothetical protein
MTFQEQSGGIAVYLLDLLMSGAIRSGMRILDAARRVR